MAEKQKKQTSTEMAEKELSKKEAKAIANRLWAIKKLEAQKKKLEKEIAKIKDGTLVPDEGSISVKDEDDESSSPSLRVIFLLDESGSMSTCFDATVNGYNEYIQKLKNDNKHIRVSLTKFNSDGITLSYTNISVSDVPELSHENYNPDGMTPLFDAIAKTINKERESGKTLFIILTDGQENDSKEYNIESVRELIKGRESKGWSFVYLGADQDAWSHAQHLGLHQGNVMSYNSRDTSKLYSNLAMSTSDFSLSPQYATKSFGKKLKKRMNYK